MLKLEKSLFLLSILVVIQLSLCNVVINRGDNANGDNDEVPTTTPIPFPPIGEQFAVVSSRLTPKEQIIKTNENESSKINENENSKVKEEEDRDEKEAENNGGEEVDAIENANEEEGRRLRSGKKVSYLKQGVNTIRQAASCGSYRLRSNQIYVVQSIHSDTGKYGYKNFELCTWKFFGQQCVLKTSCPCFDLPPSSDCIGDSLKITDDYSFSSKFCGSLKPQGDYKSTTNNLKLRFSSNSRDTGKGFVCYVTCTGRGAKDPVLPVDSCPGFDE